MGLSLKCISRTAVDMNSKKVVLIILDGWGYGDKSKSDAIHHAHTPFIDSLLERYPHSKLLTDGENVGLPDGQMGNSEVGHLNIGAGRTVYQDLVKINKAIKEKTIDKNPVLIRSFNYAKEKNVGVHFMGLVSDGGVHSSQEHLHKLCDIANDYGLTDVFVHAFADGRDRDPKSGIRHIAKLENHLNNSAGQLVSVIGRYYAMDRDERWERVKIAYDLLLNGKGKPTVDFHAAILESYDEGITDEFIKPILKTDEDGNPIGRIKENDVVICFNFRTDRCREITIAFTQKNLPEHDMHHIPLRYITMTNYNNTFKDIDVLYSKENLDETLGEILSEAGKKQIRISETEKYPHVTYFLSGGREETFEGEKRILIHSPDVATYDQKPEMSAFEVAEALNRELCKKETDFVCLNFANSDMVGHTGNYNAILKAVETVDKCTGSVVETGLKNGYSFLIIADHGNSDFVINEDGSVNTAHSLNPVPCIVIDKDVAEVKNGRLSDIAPTILTMMDLEIPRIMTGKALI